jgi:hypothetical protein
MTQRIKQFYEQCNRVVNDPFGGAHISFDHQMFAELIVQECVELNRQELSFSAFARMLDKYEDHFGVEL